MAGSPVIGSRRAFSSAITGQRDSLVRVFRRLHIPFPRFAEMPAALVIAFPVAANARVDKANVNTPVEH
jgi:hypothetical protein